MDTSVILKWLQVNYGCEVITMTADVGQEDDLNGVDEKALRTGATKAYIEDLREEFAKDFIFPMLRSGALYDVVQCLAQIGEELEYLYAFNRGSQNSAYVVLRVQDVAKSEQALAAAGYTLFSEDDLANL